MNKKLSPEDAFYENLTLGLIKTLCEYGGIGILKRTSRTSPPFSKCAQGL